MTFIIYSVFFLFCTLSNAHKNLKKWELNKKSGIFEKLKSGLFYLKYIRINIVEGIIPLVHAFLDENEWGQNFCEWRSLSGTHSI